MKALYAGSFDPFTIGHYDIAYRALTIFSKLVIGVGYNELKRGEMPVEERVRRINKIFEKDSRVSVESYSGLTVDFAKKIGAGLLIRGVRNGTEFDKEKELADINLMVLGIPTVILPAKPSYSFISSSMVRELKHNGYDVTPYLPDETIEF